MTEEYRKYLQDILGVLSKSGIATPDITSLDFEELKSVAEIVDQLLYINDILLVTDNKNKIETLFTSGLVFMGDAVRSKFEQKKVLTVEKMSNQDSEFSADSIDLEGCNFSEPSNETKFNNFGLLNIDSLEESATSITDMVEPEKVNNMSTFTSMLSDASKNNGQELENILSTSNASVLMSMLPKASSMEVEDDIEDDDEDDLDDEDLDIDLSSLDDDNENFINDNIDSALDNNSDDGDFQDDSDEYEVDTNYSEEFNEDLELQEDTEEDDVEFDFDYDSEENIDEDIEDEDDEDIEFIYDGEDNDEDISDVDVEVSDEDLDGFNEDTDDLDEDDLEFPDEEIEGYLDTDDDNLEFNEDDELTDTLDDESEDDDIDAEDLEFNNEDYEIPETGELEDDIDDEDLEMDNSSDFEEFNLDDDFDEFDEDEDLECPQDDDINDVSSDSKSDTPHESSNNVDEFEAYNLDDEDEFITDIDAEGDESFDSFSNPSTNNTALNLDIDMQNTNRDVDVVMAEGIVKFVNKAFNKLTSFGKNKE